MVPQRRCAESVPVISGLTLRIVMPFFIRTPSVAALKVDEPVTAALDRAMMSPPDSYFFGQLPAADYKISTEYRRDDGRPVTQREVYARAGQFVGIVTFTTLENELPGFVAMFDFILAGISFRPKETSDAKLDHKPNPYFLLSQVVWEQPLQSR